VKLIRFTRPALIYNAGEVAGFPDDRAEQIVALGAAVYELEPDEAAVMPADGTAVQPQPRRRATR